MEFNVEKYQNQLKTKELGRRIISLNTVDSTNNYAAILEKESKTGLGGTVIISEKQTAGRGKFDKKWLSPPGGLWFTVIIKSSLPEKYLPNITLITAYAIAFTLREKYHIPVNIKWPNDIYYQKHKVAGILTEVEKFKNKLYLNIGIGINVNVDIRDLYEYSKHSTSIKKIKGAEINRENFLAEILLSFEDSYNDFALTKNFKPIFKKIEKILFYE